MFLEKQNSKRGIALPVAMAIAAVLIILSASLIAIAATSITSTSGSVNNRQAYLNARSALEYAYSYYVGDSVSDVTAVNDEYMVMLDKDGGTTSMGAQILDDKTKHTEYNTYVVANYETATTKGDSGGLRLRAYSKSSDAFGKKSQTVSLNAFYPMNKQAKKNAVVIVDLDMNTELITYNYLRDAISLHVKQYPGENWTPFYYLWTYKDTAKLYTSDQGRNCYGYETLLKSATSYNPDGTYTKDGRKVSIASGFEENEDDVTNNVHVSGRTYTTHKLEPAGVWNGVSDSWKKGPPSFFSPGKNGWFDGTYYFTNDQVNYFNLIISRKGAVLNNSDGSMNLDSQTCEMFHLWFLNNSDRNLYIEFLKPGMKYITGAGWNGKSELQDRMLVYVKNKKTTVHFKVKGIGDTKEEALNPLKNPTISYVTVGGVDIFQKSSSFDDFNTATGNSNHYKNSELEKLWAQSGLNEKSYFYNNAETGESKMLYEGCGWWVANISTGDTFRIGINYYDKAGEEHSGATTVKPNSNNDAFVVAYKNGGEELFTSYLSEAKANRTLGVDDESYSTVKVKSSIIGSGIAPYLDYKEGEVSSEAWRKLRDKYIEGSKLEPGDYESKSFKTLDDVLKEALVLIKADKKPDSEYNTMREKIQKAIDGLKTIVCDPDTYTSFSKKIDECEDLEKNHKNEYKDEAFAVFVAETGVYKKYKGYRDNGDILDKTKDDGSPLYTTSDVIDFIAELDDAIGALELGKIDKSLLKKSIDDATPYESRTELYDDNYSGAFITALNNARDAFETSTNQTDIDNKRTALDSALSAMTKHPKTTLDTATLSDYIAQAKRLISPDTAKEDCTDDTYSTLSTAHDHAENFMKGITATTKQDDVDNEAAQLKKALDAFKVEKPDNEFSKTNDALKAEGKIRVWFKGFNKGDTIDSYVDGNGNTVKSKYVISSVSVEKCKGNVSTDVTVGSNSAKTIPLQDLMYFDFNREITGVNLTVNATHYEYGEPDSNGNRPVVSTKLVHFITKDVVNYSAHLGDGNIVITPDEYKIVTKEVDGKTTETCTLTCKKSKLTTLYVESEADKNYAYVSADEKPTYVVTAVQEGSYKVARFINEPNQTAYIKSYNTSEKVYYTSSAIDTSAGGYVVTFRDSELLDYNNRLRINIPYSTNLIKGDDTTKIVAKVNDKTYAVYFLNGTEESDKKFAFEMSADGQTSLDLVRYYVDADGNTQTYENKGLRFSKGAFDASYRLVNMTDGTQKENFTARATGASFKRYSKIDAIDVTSIYPMYGSDSGSGSAGTLNGLVSDDLLSSTTIDKLITMPVNAASGLVSVPQPFDYFAQAGNGGVPRINTGSTVIWIDSDNTYMKGKGAPNVYVWKGTYNRSRNTWTNTSDLNGPWPGREALQVDNTQYYYVVVDSHADGCVLSYNNGKNKIGGGNVQYDGGNIYFDDRDKVYTGTTNLNGHSYTHYSDHPQLCSIGQQGPDCLFEIIDGDVLSGRYTTCMRGGDEPALNKGKFFLDSYHESAPGLYTRRSNDWRSKYYYVADYQYRAKKSDTPPEYNVEIADVDTSDMTGTNLRMPFVGGDRIRIENASYYYTYGTLYSTGSASIDSNRKASNKGATIRPDNLFGGNGGNGKSMGRVGDAELSIVYDWYEYKIPVDQTNTYTFQIKGLKFNSHQAMGKKWYDNDFKTDLMYCSQLKEVYGDVWLRINSVASGIVDGLITDMTLYTTNPDDTTIEDNQDIYFSLPSGWNASDVKVVANGVGGSKEYSFTSAGGGLLKTTIPSKTPFLSFTANGGAFKARTALKGNSYILFDPSLNGGLGGWDKYEAPGVKLEKEVYLMQTIGGGYVLPKQYNSDGTVKNLGNGNASYDFPEAILNKAKPCFTDGVINSTGRSQNYSDVHNWTTAYTNLYTEMANARAYISGKNYPENIHGGKPDIYETSTIAALETAYEAAKREYISSSATPSSINAQTVMLQKAIQNVSVSTSSRIPVIFYDGQEKFKEGNLKIVYYTKKKADGTVDPSSKVEANIKDFTTEHRPIIFISTDGLNARKEIFNVKFVVGTDEGKVQEKISLYDGAWVYMDLPPVVDEETGDSVSKSYWTKNSVAEYTYISHTALSQAETGDSGRYYYIGYDQSKATEAYIVNKEVSMNKKLSDLPEVQEKQIRTDAENATMVDNASSLKIANAYATSNPTIFKPRTLNFKNDVKVTPSSGEAYIIKAGAYSFEAKQTYISADQRRNLLGETTAAETTDPNISPFTYTNVTGKGWVPVMDLYSEKARKFFTDPSNYGEYTDRSDDPVDASSLSGWVVPTTDGKYMISRTTGHNSSKSVNMTASAGEFSANKNWNYMSSKNLYFRWQANSDLKVNGNLTFTAKEVRFGSSGTVDVSGQYDKHVRFKSKTGGNEIRVEFLTDVKVKYYDQFMELHEFVIREGAYICRKADESQSFIFDLCDEEYWTTMKYVTIDNRFASDDGDYSGLNGSDDNFSDPVFTND